MVSTKGTKGEISLELKEAIIYLGHEEATGSYSKELDEAVRELKSNGERGQEYMMRITYGVEQRAAGKYIHNELIRGWYGDKDDLPAQE